MVELVDRAAIELLRSDEFVARRHQGVHDDHLRRMAGGDRQPRGATLERGHALFQDGAGRIADAGIYVSKGLQTEKRRRMIDVIEYKRGRLVDRRGAGAGGRIGLRAGVYGERIEARNTV